MKDTRTPRGFRNLAFTDIDEQSCSLRISSLASERALWFGLDIPQAEAERIIAYGKMLRNRMHLTQAMIQELLPPLRCFVETGHLDPQAPRPFFFFTDRYHQIGVLYEQWKDQEPALRLGLDLTQHVYLTPQVQRDPIRFRYYELVEQGRAPLTDPEDRADYTMHLSQQQVRELLPYLQFFAERGEFPVLADLDPILQQAYQLVGESGAPAAYTIVIDADSASRTYTLCVEEAPALDQQAIPADALVEVARCVLRALLNLGNIRSDGYEERLAALNAQGHVSLLPGKDERVEKEDDGEATPSVRIPLEKYLNKLEPPLILSLSRVSRKTVPLLFRQSYPPAKNAWFYSYTMSFGEKQIEGHCFQSKIIKVEPDVSDIISNFLLFSDGDEEAAQWVKQQLDALFTEEQLAELYETDY